MWNIRGVIFYELKKIVVRRFIIILTFTKSKKIKSILNYCHCNVDALLQHVPVNSVLPSCFCVITHCTIVRGEHRGLQPLSEINGIFKKFNHEHIQCTFNSATYDNPLSDSPPPPPMVVLTNGAFLQGLEKSPKYIIFIL